MLGEGVILTIEESQHVRGDLDTRTDFGELVIC